METVVAAFCAVRLVEHCAQCAELTLREDFTTEETCLLLSACMGRTTEMTGTLWSHAQVTGLGTIERGALLARWMTRVLGIESRSDEDILSVLTRREAKPLLASLCARKAEDQAAAQSLSEAELAAREAAQLDPDSAGIQALLSTILAQRGATDEALAFGRRAMELSPETPQLLLNQSGLLSQVGRAQEAQEYQVAAARTVQVGATYQRQLSPDSAPRSQGNGHAANGRNRGNREAARSSLTSDEVAHYRREGYVVIPSLLHAADFERIDSALTDWSNRH